jgi:Holliday junction resolvasome RuvABC endonuclease subunit
MHILAIDPATHCGYASSTGPSGTWDFSIRRDESAGMRLIRFDGKLRAINDAHPVEMVVFEAARNAGPKMQGALVVQAEMQGVLKKWCEENSIAYRGYSPSEIKKFATGKGNASKDQMIAAAKNKWPDRVIGDDNEADALWILSLAQSEYTTSIEKGKVW